jgi:hypothetical protein
MNAARPLLKPGVIRELTPFEAGVLVTSAERTTGCHLADEGDCLAGFAYVDESAAQRYADRNRDNGYLVAGPELFNGEWCCTVIVPAHPPMPPRM